MPRRAASTLALNARIVRFLPCAINVVLPAAGGSGQRVVLHAVMTNCVLSTNGYCIDHRITALSPDAQSALADCMKAGVKPCRRRGSANTSGALQAAGAVRPFEGRPETPSLPTEIGVSVAWAVGRMRTGTDL